MRRRLASLLVVFLAACEGPERSVPTEVPAPDLSLATPPVARILEEARAGVVGAPADGAAWGRYGMTLYAHHFVADAVTCFAAAETLDGEEVRWPYYRAVILAESDVNAALEPLTRAATLAPGNRTVALRLADALVVLGRTEEARARYEALAEGDGDEARVAFGRARCAAAEDDWEAALAFARDAAAREPDRIDVRQLLIRSLAQTGDREAAAAERLRLGTYREQPWPDPMLRRIVELRRDPDSVAERADHLISVRRVQEGMQLLAGLVKDYPDDPQSWARLANGLRRTGDNANAERVLAEGLAVHPESTTLSFMRGMILASVGDCVGAESMMYEVLARQADHADAHFILGHCLDEQGRFEDAIASLTEALSLEPQHVPSHVELAELLLATGRPDAARAHLEAALAPLAPELEQQFRIHRERASELLSAGF